MDDVYEETFELNGARTFSVEFLPGQFDQRADSAEQCVKLLNENEEPLIRTAVTYVIEGEISDTEFEAIKSTASTRLIPGRPVLRSRRRWCRHSRSQSM